VLAVFLRTPEQPGWSHDRGAGTFQADTPARVCHLHRHTVRQRLWFCVSGRPAASAGRHCSLDFHSASIADLGGRRVPELNAEYAKALRDVGASGRFIKEATGLRPMPLALSKQLDGKVINMPSPA